MENDSIRHQVRFSKITKLTFFSLTFCKQINQQHHYRYEISFSIFFIYIINGKIILRIALKTDTPLYVTFLSSHQYFIFCRGWRSHHKRAFEYLLETLGSIELRHRTYRRNCLKQWTDSWTTQKTGILVVF